MRPASAARGFRAGLADQLRRWNGLGLLAFAGIAVATVYYTPLGAALVLVWIWLSRTPLKEVGLVRPRSWVGGLFGGVLLGLGGKFLMKSVVLPCLGAPATNPVYHAFAGDTAWMLSTIPRDIFQAGICEEIIFRGFLFERIGRLVGRSAPAAAVVVVMSSVIFGALHFSQGLMGMENGFVTGLIFGAIYMLNRQGLFAVMVAHATFDIASSLIIYLNLEPYVSHLIFK